MNATAAQSARTIAEAAGLTFEDGKAIAEIGCDLAAAGRLEEARVLFEGLVEMNPKDAAARAALGTVHQKLGRLQEAAAEYTEAIKLDAMQPVALANRGELRLRQGDGAGVEDLLAATRADPSGITMAARRAKALLGAMAQAAAARSSNAPG
ncbi:MAG TPA: tetratricopeptide repeat protein [Myxococcales bacterium]|jgi:Flp pilus assembly protein TadD|nr:tetratricopeptide repeat protein [Myxococcales bacterium]